MRRTATTHQTHGTGGRAYAGPRSRWSAIVLRRALVLVLLLPALRPLAAAEPGTFDAALDSIRIEGLRRHVVALASDAFEGREAGSRGGKAAGAYVAGELRRTGLAAAGDEGSYFQHFEPDYRNLIAVLPGSDPELRGECLVIGAHYDHVGYGTRENSHGPIGHIHNGADDNASGTAGLLEMARALASLDPAPRRTVVFAFWDAEEKGLLGSKHWVRQPTVPLERVKLKINLDMIGRLRDDTVEMYGVRTAPRLRRFISEQNRHTDLVLEFNWDLADDSDHYPFIAKRVPVLMPYTMKHEDYHRPGDTADKVNYEGMRRVVHLMLRAVHEAANAPELPAFRPASREEDEKLRKRLAAAAPLPPRLGVAWDRTLEAQRIVELTLVSPDSPAEQAGLRVGDRLLELGGRRIADVDDFRALVQAAEGPAEVVVERRGEAEPLRLTVTLNGPPRRLGISWRVDEAEPGCVVLTRVVAGSPASRGGLKPDDRLYAVAGRTFNDEDEFRGLLAPLEFPFELIVERRGQLRKVRLSGR